MVRVLVGVVAGSVTVVLVATAFWVGGAAVSDDFRTSQAATAVLVGLVGAAAAALAHRRRALAVPVLGAFLLSAGGIGGYLLWTSTVSTSVDERVVVPAAAPVDTTGPSASPVQVAAGPFVGDAHPTSGTATLVRLPGGGHVVTLTGFETDPGPDLRVLLVRGDGSSLDGGVDLGGLKGSRGDQQYEVPPGTPLDGRHAVVVWCRAFTVAFGTAALA